MKKILFLSLFLLSCKEIRKELLITGNEEVQSIRYVKDHRTGLCFVFNYVAPTAYGGGGLVFTNVPCSPEVEKLLEK